MLTVDVQIFGKVQGVFFRKNTAEKARDLGIRGTVQNKPDGSVHILATGTEDSLEKFLDWCKQGDPPAKVEHVDVDRVDFQEFEGFEILH